MPYPFELPAFLQGESAEEIHERMLAAMPSDIDKSEGQFVWDNTRPAALEKSRLVEFQLAQSIQIMFPHWAWDEWLERHAELEGVTRLPPNRATGLLTVLGSVGSTIEAGFQFATTSNLAPSVIFETTEPVVIGNGVYTIFDTATPPAPVITLALKQASSTPLRVAIRETPDSDVGELVLFDGDEVLERFSFDTAGDADQVASLLSATLGSAYVTLTQISDSTYPLATTAQTIIGTSVPVRAVAGGADGNVPPDTIIVQVRPDSNITFVTNQTAASGGTPEETDDQLRERVLAVIRQGTSFTGCDADYVRWAKEVPGVGQVVVDPEWDDPNLPENFVWVDARGNRRKAGAVRLFIVDANGIPANQQIMDAVYDHIISPENRMLRLAPIGATLTVAAPTPIYVDVEARVTIGAEENLGVIIERFRSELFDYWQFAATENDIFDVATGTAQNWIRYVFVGSTLAGTAGVVNYEYSTLLVNGATADILIPVGAYPVTREVNLYE